MDRCRKSTKFCNFKHFKELIIYYLFVKLEILILWWKIIEYYLYQNCPALWKWHNYTAEVLGRRSNLWEQFYSHRCRTILVVPLWDNPPAIGSFSHPEFDFGGSAKRAFARMRRWVCMSLQLLARAQVKRPPRVPPTRIRDTTDRTGIRPNSNFWKSSRNVGVLAAEWL